MKEIGQATLCESAEQAFGSRDTTRKVKSILNLTREYLRLDGQCKLCLVGAGAAEANMRLPPAGYVERIWDIVPGYHYITEAGGKVTDLKGKDLDFSTGRLMSPDVTGVISSNSVLHNAILDAVNRARN